MSWNSIAPPRAGPCDLTLRRLPKVELHVHLEGAIGPSEARRLADKNGLPVGFPPLGSLFVHTSLLDFLAHFGDATKLLRSPGDLAWLLDRTLAKLRRQGVLYAEIRVSPAVWERRGIDPAPAMDAILSRMGRGPVAFRLIVDAVRQWGSATLERDLNLCLRFRGRGVVALGLGGDEVSAPALGFRSLAAECRAKGLPVVPHAGEALGPEEVLAALEVFGPARIGHGIRASEDSSALDRIARTGVHLEICPTSNRVTGAVPRGLAHAYRSLLEAGVSLSVSTDDPGLFGTTLCRELRWASRIAGQDLPEVARMQAGAARASFLSPGERHALLARMGCA